MGLRVNCRYARVILVNRNFVCRNVDPGVNNRRAEFYAGEVRLKDLYRKQGVGKNNISLACHGSNVRRLECRMSVGNVERTSSQFFQEIHRQPVQAFEYTSFPPLRISLHKLPVCKEFVWEVAIEHNPLLCQESKKWYTRRKLINKVNVIRCLSFRQ